MLDKRLSKKSYWNDKTLKQNGKKSIVLPKSFDRSVLIQISTISSDVGR